MHPSLLCVSCLQSLSVRSVSCSERRLHICEIKTSLLIFNGSGTPLSVRSASPTQWASAASAIAPYPLPWLHWEYFVVKPLPFSSSLLVLTRQREMSGCLMPRCSFQIARACINSWNATWTCSGFTSWGYSQEEYSFGWLVVHPLCLSVGSVDPDSTSCANTQATPSSQPWVFALIHMEQPVFSCAPEDAIFNTSINCLFIKGAGRSTPLWLPWFCDAVAAFLKYKLFWMRWNRQVLKLNRYACVMMANL